MNWILVIFRDKHEHLVEWVHKIKHVCVRRKEIPPVSAHASHVSISLRNLRRTLQTKLVDGSKYDFIVIDRRRVASRCFELTAKGTA